MKIELENAVVYQGSNLDVLPTLPDNLVDSIVTDPPYELGFMGKSWDNSGIAYSVELWTECMRVLKPGGHLLAFGGSRTWHRLAVAIEDAGFEMRDSIAWLYGSGFPKSMDISKQIDKQAGAERAESTTKPTQERSEKGELLKNQRCSECGKTTFSANPCQCPKLDRIAITSEAKQWQGWGTALKPAFEPVVVARKPLEEKTVAANVLKYGTGGLNIDGSRIGTEERTNQPAGNKADANGVYKFSNAEVDAFNGTEATTVQGRWPANVILGHTPDCQPTGQTITSKTGAGKRTATFGTQETQSGGDGSGGWSGYEYQTEVYACVDGCPVKLLDEQSGISKSQGGRIGKKDASNVDFGLSGNYAKGDPGFGDVGGASRYFKVIERENNESTNAGNPEGNRTNQSELENNTGLGSLSRGSGMGIESDESNSGRGTFIYQAKASKKDRNEGLDHLEVKRPDDRTETGMGSFAEKGVQPGRNFHPTVKPTALMEYLIKLVTPPNGTVLDPFTGSGSTGKAALLNGFKFIGIELTEEYLPIIEGRLKWASEQVSKETNEVLF